MAASDCMFIQYLYLNCGEAVHQSAGWPGLSRRVLVILMRLVQTPQAYRPRNARLVTILVFAVLQGLGCALARAKTLQE